MSDDAPKRAEPGPAPAPREGRTDAAGRLAAPPSQRYVRAARAAPQDAAEASLARGAAMGLLVAAFCAAIIVVLGGVFAFTAGLIVVAFFLGRLTAIGVNVGVGRSISEDRRLALAVGLSILGVIAAQLGLWAWSVIVQPGALGPIDFLAQTYGMLVPLELLLAGGAAWLTAS